MNRKGQPPSAPPRQEKPWPVARMLTLSEVAQTCGVSRNTVTKWVKVGLLRVKRFGRRCVRVTREDFDRMVAGAAK